MSADFLLQLLLQVWLPIALLVAVPIGFVIGMSPLISRALDPFIPRADMEEMAATMPRCRLVVNSYVGHSMLIEKPERYARLLTQFLAEAD